MRETPPDFAIHSADEGNLKLRKRYRCSGRQIDAWRKATGVVFVVKARPSKPIKLPGPPCRKRGDYRIDSNDYFAIADGFDEFGIDDLYRGVRLGENDSYA